MDTLVRDVLSGVAGVLALAWVAANLLPPQRRRGLDWALAWALTAVAAGLLWSTWHLSADSRRFWGYMAAAWTATLLGNAIWGVHDLQQRQRLPPLSALDAVYIARYMLLAAALWQGVSGVPPSRWVGVPVAIAASLVVARRWLYRSHAGRASAHTARSIGKAVYPVLDSALVYTAAMAWASAPGLQERISVALTTLAIAVYGAANWINLRSRAYPLETSVNRAALLWPLSDIVIGVAALHGG
ncbi:MAG: hypothetical protein E3J64_07555 [Anaerolineales bacterium]|nr:MAG: hypothetical protein E3J64_07555 [Anaerolineales bacterium]